MPREARYRVIARRLGDLIRQGELRPGQQLPTEDALAREYGVHRLTARQAVLELRRTGLVETRHGAGSFVRLLPRRVEVTVDPATRRHRPADLEGVFTEERPVRQGHVPDPVAAAHLGLTGADVLEVVTLLGLDGGAGVSSRYHLAPQDGFAWQGSVLGALEPFEYAWHAVSADLAGLEDAELLGVEPGSPILVREGLVRRAGEPLCHIVRRCRGDLVSFVTRYD
ncbi:GntR family transcriptional regulator [Nonomuraea sp. NPDC050310]|uniref:GntR family transcriptional regulator n=1 Tax=unclassified Nonomuraea TaxID=2593643 RepID=UPI0033DFC5CF